MRFVQNLVRVNRVFLNKQTNQGAFMIRIHGTNELLAKLPVDEHGLLPAPQAIGRLI